MFEKRLEQLDRLFDKVKELELKSFVVWGPKGCFKKQIVLRLLEKIYGYKFDSLYENKPNFFSFVFGKQVGNELLSDREFLREILNDVLWQKRINNEIITVYVEFGNDPQRMRDIVEVPDFFLKIVEEPPENTYFIFLSDFQIISTLRSRCIEIYAPLFSDEESAELLVSLDKNLENDEEFANLVYGCPGLLSDKDEATLKDIKEKVKLMKGFIKSEKFGNQSYLFDNIYKDVEPYLSIFFFKSQLLNLFKKREIDFDKYLSILNRIKIANEFYLNRVSPSSIFLITNFLLDSKEI
ncbi:MAG TPA: hypothetical protein ENO30_05460 [Thermodesulfobium narugense]|uniref:DNA polymerase-3 subunit delta n=1 Tax=Thermodesulfobium acidiphilum TaxID=1794699 RepID=A0A2R4VZV6_THEAF|nr:hypothetical protein [Thermodesulfobium acidiphilum]AWB10093.1 hypothetical protein TDSAC_0725 [Thermodesulfobium acidiphilum]PMP85984.1 MAG: hypothetical protein C0174_02815 [Thermodesulfobium narugense]HEM56191.1 hypothetical protein [Thermodesulfobium narugense]